MIEELVDPFELLGFAALLLRRQQVLPSIDTALPCPQRPIQGLGTAADLGKIPVGVQAAQQQAAEHYGKAQPAHGQVNSPTYRQCEKPAQTYGKTPMVRPYP
ncbi:hypothetical protein D3C77_263070 [compost metagenome]